MPPLMPPCPGGCGRGASCGGPRAQRLFDQLLGRLAGCVRQQPVGLLGSEAEARQSLARERARVVAARDDDALAVATLADLLAQLDDDALGGALADAGYGLEAGGVAGGDGVEEL